MSGFHGFSGGIKKKYWPEMGKEFFANPENADQYLAPRISIFYNFSNKVF